MYDFISDICSGKQEEEEGVHGLPGAKDGLAPLRAVTVQVEVRRIGITKLEPHRATEKVAKPDLITAAANNSLPGSQGGQKSYHSNCNGINSYLSFCIEII